MSKHLYLILTILKVLAKFSVGCDKKCDFVLSAISVCFNYRLFHAKRCKISGLTLWFWQFNKEIPQKSGKLFHCTSLLLTLTALSLLLAPTDLSLLLTYTAWFLQKMSLLTNLTSLSYLACGKHFIINHISYFWNSC